MEGWDRDLQRDGRRTSARPDVKQAWVRAEMRAMAVSAVEVARGNQRLDQKPVDGFVWGILQRERREIDFLVPELEKSVVGREGLTALGVQADVRPPGSLRQPVAELPWRHG